MSIKKNTLLAASCLIAVVGVSLLEDVSKEKYFPRATNTFQQERVPHRILEL
ncbi:MAG: hypothetical protein ACI9DK_002053 [Vicingaceae bacterium]|jgi:hypothetical protein